MCIVRVDTNVSASDIDETFLVQSTESLANTFKKPKSVSIYLISFNLNRMVLKIPLKLF